MESGEEVEWLEDDGGNVVIDDFIGEVMSGKKGGAILWYEFVVDEDAEVTSLARGFEEAHIVSETEEANKRDIVL